MDSVIFENIVARIKESYYLDLLVFILSTTSMIIAARFGKKEMLSYLFIIYSFCSLLLLLLVYVMVITKTTGLKRFRIMEKSNILFAALEYITFYYFFKGTLFSRKVKIAMKYFSALFITLVSLFFFNEIINTPTRSTTAKFSSSIVTLELLFLAFLCAVYYFELFIKKPVLDLLKSPSFWIVSGLFFYAIIIIPFFTITERIELLNRYLSINFYAIHYLTICFLFLTIIKAFLCKKTLTA